MSEDIPFVRGKIIIKEGNTHVFVTEKPLRASKDALTLGQESGLMLRMMWIRFYYDPWDPPSEYYQKVIDNGNTLKIWAESDEYTMYTLNLSPDEKSFIKKYDDSRYKPHVYVDLIARLEPYVEKDKRKVVDFPKQFENWIFDGEAIPTSKVPLPPAVKNIPSTHLLGPKRTAPRLRLVEQKKKRKKSSRKKRRTRSRKKRAVTRGRSTRRKSL